MFLMFLNVFNLGETFQLSKFSFTYSVKDLGVYNYFSWNYGYFVYHEGQRVFWEHLDVICLW